MKNGEENTKFLHGYKTTGTTYIENKADYLSRTTLFSAVYTLYVIIRSDCT